MFLGEVKEGEETQYNQMIESCLPFLFFKHTVIYFQVR